MAFRLISDACYFQCKSECDHDSNTAPRVAYVYLELVALVAALYNSWSETARNG